MQKSVEGNQCDRGTDHQGVWGKKAGRKPKEQESGINNIGDLISVLLHYFPKFPDWLASIKDFRFRERIIFQPELIVIQLRLRNVFSVNSPNPCH